MYFTYDPKLNVAYIRFSDSHGPLTSHEITSDLVIDVEDDGRVYGIELLNAGEQLKKSDGKFHFLNSLTQERREILLPVG